MINKHYNFRYFLFMSKAVAADALTSWCLRSTASRRLMAALWLDTTERRWSGRSWRGQKESQFILWKSKKSEFLFFTFKQLISDKLRPFQQRYIFMQMWVFNRTFDILDSVPLPCSSHPPFLLNFINQNQLKICCCVVWIFVLFWLNKGQSE